MRTRTSAVVALNVLVVVFVVSCASEKPARTVSKQASPGGMPVAVSVPTSREAPRSARGYAAMPATEAAGAAVEAAEGERQKSRRGPIRTWKRSQAVPNASKLMIGDQDELGLERMSAEVRVDGFRARVVLDLFYRNDQPRRLEGTFKLRLPDGANPYYFAFGEQVAAITRRPRDKMAGGPGSGSAFDVDEIRRDRDGQWRNVKEARMVPREKAALAYTETARRRVDPALMEWAGAGVFNARVFPLSPNKLHRIVVGYDVDLVQAGSDLEYRLDLPEFAPQLTVDLDVAVLDGAPLAVSYRLGDENVEAGAVEIADDRATFRIIEDGVASVTARYTDPGTIVLAGTDAKTGGYFATRFRPELPDDVAAGGAGRAVFLVDTSLSSNPDRFNIWLDLMKAVLENNRETTLEFSVLFFNIEAYWWRERFVANTAQNVRELAEYCDQLALEGATNLAAPLRLCGDTPWLADMAGDVARLSTDAFLLSDGAATWGESDVHMLSELLAKANLGTLFSYTTGMAGTDRLALERLASAGGGAIFSVVGEAEIRTASIAHRSRPWRIRQVFAGGLSDVLLAGNPRSVYPGQVLTLCGRGRPDADAELGVLLSSARERREAWAQADHVVESPLAARVFGQVATMRLEEFGATTEKASAAYSRHFRVTGKTCSLVMLDRESDYRRFDINPRDDAGVVKREQASVVIARSRAQIGDTLSDAKRRFVDWLRKMEKQRGFRFRAPSALWAAIERTPRDAFQVEPVPLRCSLRMRDELPAKLSRMLGNRKLDYDTIQREANRRSLSGKGRARASSPHADALKALSSLVENAPGDGVLARDVAYSAMAWGLDAQAFHLLRRVAEARPWEPQTYHAMAQLLGGERAEGADLALLYYEVALAGQWNARFGAFRQIVGLDYLRFLRAVTTGGAKPGLTVNRDFAERRLKAIQREFDTTRGAGADILVTVAWNTDSTDIDLHVLEPTGEECYYRNKRTRIGGSLTQDVTEGYGPEMYVLRKARSGSYRVRVKFYSSDDRRTSVRTKAYATVYRNWGRPNERVTRKVVTLVSGREIQDVGSFVVGDGERRVRRDGNVF